MADETWMRTENNVCACVVAEKNSLLILPPRKALEQRIQIINGPWPTEQRCSGLNKRHLHSMAEHARLSTLHARQPSH